MSDLDDLFTITCGKCGKTAPLTHWLRYEHVNHHFTCPHCDYAFMRVRKKNRKPWEPFVELVEVWK